MARRSSGPDIVAYVLSCPERESVRLQTLENLRRTDWNEDPRVEIDQTTFERHAQRHEHTSLRLIERAVGEGRGFILFLEDDLEFNRRNLERWYPLNAARDGRYFFGSLYNPNLLPAYADDERPFAVVNPGSVYGSQAFIFSLATARYFVRHWWEVPGAGDIKMSRLAARLAPIYYHRPSLVQHLDVASVGGGPQHAAVDYDRTWKAKRSRFPPSPEPTPSFSAWSTHA